MRGDSQGFQYLVWGFDPSPGTCPSGHRTHHDAPDSPSLGPSLMRGSTAGTRLEIELDQRALPIWTVRDVV
jgi:hypothetical protein